MATLPVAASRIVARLASGDLKDATVAELLTLLNVAAGATALTLGTKQTSTSGTAIDFTGLPAGLKQVMISFQGVSLSGTDNLLVQLGDSGGFETTGYVGYSNAIGGSGNTVDLTTGWPVRMLAAADTYSGIMILTRMDASHLWAQSHNGRLEATRGPIGGGDKTLSAELTQIRITRTGTNTFDAGSINIMHE